MRNRLMLLLAVPALVYAADSLDQQVKAAAAGFEGKVFVYAKNLNTGVVYNWNGEERVRTASTIKLPVMVAAFRMAEAGELKWDEPLTLRAEDIVSGSGVLQDFSTGIQLPLRDVMRMMIVVSDNTGTNLMIDRIGANRVNAEMDRLGLPLTRLNRKVRGDGNNLKSPSGFSDAGKIADNARFGLGVSTPREMVTLLEKLERGEVVSAAASTEMLSVMMKNRDMDCIRRTFPDATPVANKTGALDALRSDVGIVYGANGPVAMAITTDGMPRIDYSPDNRGAILISKLAAILAAADWKATPSR